MTYFSKATNSSGSERLGEFAHVGCQYTVGPQELNVCSVNLYLTSLALLEVLVAAQGGEAPVLGDDDLLAAREPVTVLEHLDKPRHSR